MSELSRPTPSLFGTQRAIEDRIKSFDRRPDDKELGTDLGYGLMGTSSIHMKEYGQLLKVEPLQIPIKYVTIWMYFVLALLATISFFVGMGDTLTYVMFVFAGLFIIPAMMTALSWINEQTGNEPYLVFDKSTGNVELPRLSSSYSKDQLREIIFLDRFVQDNRYWQVGLLVEEQGSWTYLHLFNEAGTGTGMGWMGVKELYENIGDELGIELRRLKFTREASKSLV